MALKLHVLDLGRVRADVNFLVPATVVATAAQPNPPGKLIDIPIIGYLIEHPDGNIVFDTGCHPDCMGPNGRWPQDFQKLFPYMGGEECQLPNRLRTLGYGPDEIKYCVLSHMHNDHAGCVEFFRKSKVIVHEDELSAAMRYYALRDHSMPYIWKDIDTWLKSELDWHLIEHDAPDRRLIEGVQLLNLGIGHASGMLALQVSLRSRPGVLLVSDACYNATNYGPPVRVPGFMTDSGGFRRTLHRIRALSEAHGYDVWFGHDPDQFASLTKSTEGFYE